MESLKCEEYLTYETVEAAFKIIPDGFSDEEKLRREILHDKVLGRLYECYREIFIIRLVTRHKRGCRENRLEEVAEDSFITALQSFEKYVAANGLYQRAKVKNIFFEFYRRTFLYKLRSEINAPAGSGIPDDDIGIGANNEESDYLMREDNFYCLEQYLQQEYNRDVTIIIWRHFEKLSPLEIADRLHTSYHYATTLIFRCMERLRDFMEKCKRNRNENQH